MPPNKGFFGVYIFLESKLGEKPFILSGFVSVKRRRNGLLIYVEAKKRWRICGTYFSSNLAFTSPLALPFRDGSLNISLLTLFLSKFISTEYL